MRENNKQGISTNASMPSGVPRWELFEHFADIGIRGIGRTPSEAFEQGALALTGVITDPALVKLESTFQVQCEAPDLELLFVEWINTLIYEMAVRKMLFSHFKVVIENTSLEAVVGGEPLDRVRHQPAVEVKGATFTALKVYRTDGGVWVAQCVVDV